MDNVQQQVDILYKTHFGKLVASLLYSSRDIDPATAEDLVQDSFSSALDTWRKNGIPDNPTAWLHKVCRNKALNKLRQSKRLQGFHGQEPAASVETRFSESVLDDQPLKLLFACAHPDLSPKIQVVITLKYVVNLKVEAIARILGMTLDGVDKLLLRARQKIKTEKILLEEPRTDLLHPRLGTVKKVLYLIFNEGYKSSWGKELIREELCEEALLMTRLLLQSPLGDKETMALYALMLFNASRFKTRFDAGGQLVELEQQDRSQWNADLLALAHFYLDQSRDDTMSTYHIEACIAYLHAAAPSFAATNWEGVCRLYTQLLLISPNPFVQLNYAIALYYAGHRVDAFSILNELSRQPFFAHYYLLNATLGKLHALSGHTAEARQFLSTAINQTSSEAERELIRRRLEILG